MQFDTDLGGSRLASSVGGSLLGLGGDVLIVDDPHNTESVESEAERENVLTWFKELSTTRLNDPKQAALVVIMQRLHEADVSGHILSSGDDEFVHLMIPMEYEWRRHCVTSLGWHDPRGVSDDGEPLIEMTADGPMPVDTEAERVLEQERSGALMWPERFGAAEVAAMHAGLVCSKARSRGAAACFAGSGGNCGTLLTASSRFATSWLPRSTVRSRRRRKTIRPP